MIIMSSRRSNPIGCLIGGVLGLVVMYYLLRGLWTLLYWAAPILVVLAVIINWRAVADTGKSYVNFLRTNPLGGILVLIISVFAFPLLSLYLFLKAIGNRQLEKMEDTFGQARGTNTREPEPEFTDFEELESRPKNPPPMAKPDIPVKETEVQEPPKQEPNPYNDLFK
jgi:hypothetical protein